MNCTKLIINLTVHFIFFFLFFARFIWVKSFCCEKKKNRNSQSSCILYWRLRDYSQSMLFTFWTSLFCDWYLCVYFCIYFLSLIKICYQFSYTHQEFSIDQRWFLIYFSIDFRIRYHRKKKGRQWKKEKWMLAKWSSSSRFDQIWVAMSDWDCQLCAYSFYCDFRLRYHLFVVWFEIVNITLV